MNTSQQEPGHPDPNQPDPNQPDPAQIDDPTEPDDPNQPDPAQIDSLWPTPGTAITDDVLLSRYAVPDRSHPTTRVNFISSVDGAATSAGLSGALGVPADKRLFDLLRRLCDVVLVGAGTVRAEGYGPMVMDEQQVAWRRSAGLADHPVFAIVSGRLDLDPASRIFTEAPVRPIVITTGSSDAAARRALDAVADVLVCGDDELDARAVRAALTAHGLPQVHCEGGPRLFGALAAGGVVDEVCLTLSPMLVSGDAGRILGGALPGDAPLPLRLAQVLRSRDALLLRYLLAPQ
ncbi:riboflavin biosynthesis pyrimidine reductase [Glaciihabitans tibetensis]|uniref:Riboflavin biosynthesis pyrimidine reductase n=1 Tax=Glaciihabitans tibetensis TaxID=1266600 RepID=A0A2T0VAJ8_9MICO|nr:pyrimidine reductase family protein [Glaciihabitans tibetensis]PRY67181.1 riboflavin biosynthesis pyrimidine reductase [Glaciihabitans tibetensis]